MNIYIPQMEKILPTHFAVSHLYLLLDTFQRNIVTIEMNFNFRIDACPHGVSYH